MVYNLATLGQYARTMTGSAIALSGTSIPVKWFAVRNRAGNAAVTVGFISTPLPISLAASAEYQLTAPDELRIDLSELFINGTNTQLVDVLYMT